MLEELESLGAGLLVLPEVVLHLGLAPAREHLLVEAFPRREILQALQVVQPKLLRHAVLPANLFAGLVATEHGSLRQ